MAVPEATVDEYNRPVLWKHKIWPTGELLGMEPESEARSMEVTPHDQLRPGVGSADPRHPFTTTFRRQGIDQWTPLWHLCATPEWCVVPVSWSENQASGAGSPVSRP